MQFLCAQARSMPCQFDAPSSAHMNNVWRKETTKLHIMQVLLNNEAPHYAGILSSLSLSLNKNHHF
jgi:hypothetical protein